MQVINPKITADKTMGVAEEDSFDDSVCLGLGASRWTVGVFEAHPISIITVSKMHNDDFKNLSTRLIIQKFSGVFFS